MDLQNGRRIERRPRYQIDTGYADQVSDTGMTGNDILHIHKEQINTFKLKEIG